MINSRIACSEVATLSDIKVVTVRVNSYPLNSHIIFCVLYLPPHCSDECYKCCFSFINTLCNLDNLVIIEDDFNFPTASKECNLIFNLNLIQFVEQH